MLSFRQASVTVYVLVTTTGHVPDDASLEVTTNLASIVHASEIVNPNPSSAVTVLTAAVASLALQPSTVVVLIVPVMDGGVVSSTLIV